MDEAGTGEGLTITLFVDNQRSWILPYVERLSGILQSRGFTTHICHNHENIVQGDMAFLLGCERILPPTALMKNKRNLVAHPSDLPKGRGHSPLTWQILEGKNEIPVVLFEAKEDVDTGAIFLRDTLIFEGHELNEELKRAQGDCIVDLVLRFVADHRTLVGEDQAGESTWYKKRTPVDSLLDPTKSIADQFNLLRVVDNERYPAFFVLDGHEYVLEIRKAKQEQ